LLAEPETTSGERPGASDANARFVNSRRSSGEVVLGGRRFLLRRVYFPEDPTPEWFVVDLLQHHDMAGVALSELREGLVATLRLGRWERERLREMAETYGTKATLALVEDALHETEASAA
jgi:hypothetical protein